METHGSALILPQRRYWMVRDEAQQKDVPHYDGGVFDVGGAAIPAARHLGRGHLHTQAPVEPPPDPILLSGRWLYGGMLRGHFGHFMVESLGRLWAAGLSGAPLSGTVLLNLNGIPRNPERRFSDADVARRARQVLARSYVTDLIRRLTGLERIVVAGLAVQVERLLVPQQILGDHPVQPDYRPAAFKAFFRHRLGQAMSVASSDARVYVSRARLPRQTGRPVLEDWLEASLREEGYEILHPEAMPLAEQMARYARAGTLLACAGSSLHLAIPCLPEGARLGIIGRQPRRQPKFSNQAREMGMADVHDLDACHGEFRANPAGPGRLAPNQAVVVWDLERIWAQLQEAGFVSAPVLPLAPSEGERAAAIGAAAAALERELGMAVEFRRFR